MSGSVVFRADASIQIGSGHVMRCLALADRLSQSGNSCSFITRDFPGNLSELIRRHGHKVFVLNCDTSQGDGFDFDSGLSHSAWLGVSQIHDAVESSEIVGSIEPDWLVVDHYALDTRWERKVCPPQTKLLVIDDLADRSHNADLLVDQTFGRPSTDYLTLLPPHCKVLAGSEYALLRPEFSFLRKDALRQRSQRPFGNVLVNLGGADKNNCTKAVLEVLNDCSFPEHTTIRVVLGEASPWVAAVDEAAGKLKWPTEVIVGAQNMAELMAQADLAIGAAGSTSWERCVLGLPSIQIVVAENQRLIAELLSRAGAVKVVEDVSQLPSFVATMPEWLSEVSERCSKVADGMGCDRVVKIMEAT